MGERMKRIFVGLIITLMLVVMSIPEVQGQDPFEEKREEEERAALIIDAICGSVFLILLVFAILYVMPKKCPTCKVKLRKEGERAQCYACEKWYKRTFVGGIKEIEVQNVPQYPQYQNQSQYPQQPHYCSTCSNPARFIQNNNTWWCDNCQKYV
jgi:hypothetical protein